MSVRRVALISMHTSPLAQPGTGDGGGMNVYVRALAAALARAGVECDVLTRTEHAEQAPLVEVEPGFRVLHLDAGPRSPVPKRDLPDLVGPFTDAALDRFLTSGESYDVLHANYWLSGAVGHRLKHELSLPLVATFHTLDRVKAEAGLGEDLAVRSRTEREVVDCSDLILASTDEEERQLIELYGGGPERIAIVPPGVDHTIFTPGDRAAARRALDLPVDGPVLLFVGRIQPLKRADLAVRALAGLGEPNATLVLVGGPSGPDGEDELVELRALVESLGLAEQVRFVAPQPHAALADFYRAADVCLVPSRTESFGLVALEAAACGTPVVAAAVGGLRAIVADGESGFLVDGREPADYAEPVRLLLDDPEFAARMAAEAAARSQRYAWSVTAARLRRLYADLAVREPVQCR
jgi:D-inositol-3-phosphate glycosyltransferase